MMDAKKPSLGPGLGPHWPLVLRAPATTTFLDSAAELDTRRPSCWSCCSPPSSLSSYIRHYAMETQTGSDEEDMSTLRLEFFKNLCKHQAAQITDLNAQVATQHEHIARLEAYILKLETKSVSKRVCISGPFHTLFEGTGL